MRTQELLSVYATKCIESEPLTKQECANGSAIRIVSCTWSNDMAINMPASGFVWSALIFSKSCSMVQGPRVHVSLFSRIKGLLRGNSILACVPVQIGKTKVVVEGTAWSVFEYEFYLPATATEFSLHLQRQGARYCIRLKDYIRFTESFYASIRNAAADEEGYALWLKRHRERASLIPVPQERFLVSIVCPVFKTPPSFLREMIRSVECQTYSRWELVLVNASPDDKGVLQVLNEFDDTRIHIVDCPENAGIAANTNLGIAYAQGDYVCFLDHDDTIEPYALAAMVTAILGSDTRVDALYCDEDSIDECGVNRIPLFKPPCNIDLFYSNNYAIHWLMVSRHVLDCTERSGSEVDGAQDYDLILKAVECGGAVVRVPYVLYHWRIHAGSTNGGNADAKPYAQEAGRRAIANHLARRKIPARVAREPVVCTYRTDFPIEGAPPTLVCFSLGEPNKSLREALSGYRAYGSRVRLCVLSREDESSYVEDLNRALDVVSEDLILIVDGDLFFDTEGLLGIAGYFVRDEVFSVAPRVLRQDGLVDYAGCIVSPDGALIKLGRLLPSGDEGYIGRLHRPYSAAVLNGDCCLFRAEMMRNRRIDTNFATVAHALADICLSAYEDGLVNVYDSFATATWKYPRSLLVYDDGFGTSDAALLLNKHGLALIDGDPSHNPNFDPRSPYYLLRKL